MPCQCNSRGALSKLKGAPPQRKIDVTSKSPVEDISVVTLIRTDTTLDHRQKAEKVCGSKAHTGGVHTDGQHMCWLCGAAEGVVQGGGAHYRCGCSPTYSAMCLLEP